MKKSALLIICCLMLLLPACAAEPASEDVPRLPWPSHAPEATPYVRAPEHSETPPTPQGEFYDSWEELLESFYVAENNFWFHDWELEMFNALPQDETYDFTVHLATSVGHDNDEVMEIARVFDELGVHTEVWDMQSVFDGEEEHYYVCFIRCTPNELWEISGKTQEYYTIEQKYESVAQRCDIRIFPTEGEPVNG